MGVIGGILIILCFIFFWKSPEEKFTRKIKNTIEIQKYLCYKIYIDKFLENR